MTPCIELETSLQERLFLPIGSIVAIESSDDTTLIHLINGRTHRIKMYYGDLKQKLEQA
jgi:hypothetical protein